MSRGRPRSLMSIRSSYAVNCRWRPARPFIESARGRPSSLVEANGCDTVRPGRKVRNTLPYACLPSRRRACTEPQTDRDEKYFVWVSEKPGDREYADH